MEELITDLRFTSDWWAIMVPMLLCILDILTGYTYAWINNDVKSVKMRTGLGKKFGELVYVIVGVITKFAFGTSTIMIFTSAYICFMEVVSLAENCAKLGVPLPDKLKDKLNNENDKEEG